MTPLFFLSKSPKEKYFKKNKTQKKNENVNLYQPTLMIHFWAGPYSFLYAHSAPTLFSRACRAVVGLDLKSKYRVSITSVMSLGLCGLGKRQPFRQVGSWSWRSTILIFVPFPLSFCHKMFEVTFYSSFAQKFW